MALSGQMRKLKNKWTTGTSWKQMLEWVELHGLRGWTGHRIVFGFPIVAIVGENGSGKSTVLQAASSVYVNKIPKAPFKFAYMFFPDTPWDSIKNARIQYSVKLGEAGSYIGSLRKTSDRWRGNTERKPRDVYYIDLSRIQPLSARSGYVKIAKATAREGGFVSLDETIVTRLSGIMGHVYTEGKMATADVDPHRQVPVIAREGQLYSGFHQGAGELTATELLVRDFKKNSLVLIDEIESSLHPRAQRRLIRDLAEIARVKEIQFIITTHSPYVLEEIPPEGRLYIVQTDGGKSTVTGVSPDFAMTQMDDEGHPECDVYVEDERSACLVREIIIHENRDIVKRVQLSPFGASSVGASLGMMVAQDRFSRPTVVFLDGDQEETTGVHLLPGEDAPEIVVFSALRELGWTDVPSQIARGAAETIDALNAAMAVGDHHLWLNEAANKLDIGSQQLWQVLCVVWTKRCSTPEQRRSVVDVIVDALE